MAGNLGKGFVLMVLGACFVLLPGCVSTAEEGRELKEDAFSRLDENGDGLISPEEFGGDEVLFKRFDRDGDGFISRGEITPRRPGPPPQRSLPDSRPGASLDSMSGSSLEPDGK